MVEYNEDDYPESDREQALQLFDSLKGNIDKAYGLCLGTTSSFDHKNKLPDRTLVADLSPDAREIYSKLVQDNRELTKTISKLRVNRPHTVRPATRQISTQGEGAPHPSTTTSSIFEAIRTLTAITILKSDDKTSLQGKADSIAKAFKTIDLAECRGQTPKLSTEESARLAQTKLDQIKDMAKELKVEVLIDKGAEDAIFGQLN